MNMPADIQTLEAERQSLTPYTGEPLCWWEHSKTDQNRLETCAISRAGTRHAYEDGACTVIDSDGNRMIVLVDGATGSYGGISGGMYRSKILADARLLATTKVAMQPAELLTALQLEIKTWRKRIHPDAGGGAAVVSITLENNGHFKFSSAGDIAIYLYHPKKLLRPARLKRLNVAARTPENELTCFIGQEESLCVEIGQGNIPPGGILVVATDGAMTMPESILLSSLSAWTSNTATLTLNNLIEKLDAQAREYEKESDDRTLALVHRTKV